MAYPQIIYTPVGGAATTLLFTYPPIQKPQVTEDGSGDERKREGADSITQSGLKQSITFRIDTFRTVNMENVPMTDLANWRAFMDYALTGGQFDYYPDQTLAAFDTWTLEELDWPPKYNFFGYSKFSFKMRKLVVPTVGP
jgi:hypothetical protein